MDKKVLKLKQALNSMLVATDTEVELPVGHPGHDAYLKIVARPRAVAALLEFEESVPSASANTDYTAALTQEISSFYADRKVSYGYDLITALATRLNSVVKKQQQNCV